MLALLEQLLNPPFLKARIFEAKVQHNSRRHSMKILAKRIGSGAALALIAALLLAGMAAAAPGAVGWVGNMFPAGGSSSSKNVGDPFTVYVRVWKAGVTDAPGQGAGITCTLYWGKVDSFGGVWSIITETSMVYNPAFAGSPSNDEYLALISPGAGLYEFTAYCSDSAQRKTLADRSQRQADGQRNDGGVADRPSWGLGAAHGPAACGRGLGCLGGLAGVWRGSAAEQHAVRCRCGTSTRTFSKWRMRWRSLAGARRASGFADIGAGDGRMLAASRASAGAGSPLRRGGAGRTG